MNDVLISFSGLRKRFDGLQVLDGVSARVRRGEVVLIEGNNGAGKTTLLNILGGALAADAGEIRFANEACFRYPEPRWRRVLALPALRPEIVAQHGIGRVWQDVRLFGSLNLADNLAAADPSHPGESPLANLWRAEAVRRHEQALQEQARESLAALGLSAHQGQGGNLISLGQSKRVAMARAHAAKASLLLLDEPLAGLDDGGRAQLVADLHKKVSQRGLALVIVEHASNRTPMMPLVTTRWRLANGKLDVSAIDDLSGAPGTHTTGRNTTPGSDALSDFLAALDRLAPPRYQRHIPLPGGALLHVVGHRDATGIPALQVSGASVHRGERHPVAGGEQGATLDFALYDGETAILRAPNGWGKTSLFEALAGLLPMRSGTLHMANGAGAIDMTGLPVCARRRAGLAFLQSRDQGFPGLTPQEALLLSGIDVVPGLLQALSRRRIANLSGGERQLLALLCVLQPPDARVRLLDEPFTGLDADTQSAVLRAHWRVDGVNLIALPGNG